ncbi:MAG TPA: histidine kinase [Methylophilaceae bacterium]|nr:histidine kinase [Methylophilaceae bacterium]
MNKLIALLPARTSYKYRKNRTYLLGFLQLPKLIHQFVINHKLYANLHALVVSMVLAVILIQAGSLFLYDYIPDNLSLIKKTYHDQSIWKNEIYKLNSNFDEKAAVYNRLSYSLNEMESHEYSWARNQSDTDLAEAYKNLQKAHVNFSEARMQDESREVMVALGQHVIDAYGDFIAAAQNDVIVKQSMVSLLQFICLFLVFCIAACIMLTSWSILINRLGRVLAIFPNDLLAGVGASKNPHDDEFDLLEKLVAELSARHEGIKAETSWVNETSTGRVRKMILSQDFLFTLVKLIGSSGLSEQTVKKALYSLERTLDVGNVALVFSENGSRISAQRALFSSMWPASFDEEMFDEMLNPVSVSQTVKVVDGNRVQCLSVPLPGPTGWLGLLMLETEANHFFEDSELQLVEVTAQLLALSMGYQAREQESRRVALLEERAVIARELHDSLAQSLSYLKFQLARLQTNFGKNSGEPQAKEIADEMREGLDNAYRELRELLTTFRVQMDIRGLDHVLKEAIEEFSQRSSLNIALDNRLGECKLSVNEEFHLLHVVREALSNIVRHSGARKVTITLIKQSAGDVLVTIDDDGIGCNSFDEKKPHHYGLTIMTERAYCLGGKIEILPRRRGGTRVKLLFRPK